MTRVAVIGAGQAGAALAHGAARAGMPVVAVAARSADRAVPLAAALGAHVASAADAAAAADLVVLAVPDAAIADVAESLAESVAQFRPDAAVVHCSGATPLAALAPLAARGVRTGVVHPVTPLVPPDDPATLFGKPFGIEADTDAGWLVDLVHAFGGTPVDLRGVPRDLYHAACVIASNLVVGLGAMADAAFTAAGVDPVGAQVIAGSLMTSAARAVAAHGPAAALTGPLRRGDAAVIAGHLVALDAVDPGVADAYRAVSQHLLALVPTEAARAAGAAALAAPSPGPSSA